MFHVGFLTLTEEQQQLRVKLSRSLLLRLESTPVTEVITADESWFYYNYSQKGQWARSRDEVEMRPKRVINSPKIMVIVMWT